MFKVEHLDVWERTISKKLHPKINCWGVAQLFKEAPPYGWQFVKWEKTESSFSLKCQSVEISCRKVDNFFLVEVLGAKEYLCYESKPKLLPGHISWVINVVAQLEYQLLDSSDKRITST